MSCCNNKNKNMVSENYEYSGNYHHPLDYDVERQTYTIDNASYYAPPWPATRTTFDMNLQTKFSTAAVPDYINYSSDVKQQAAMQSGEATPARKSMSTGRYDSFSY